MLKLQKLESSVNGRSVTKKYPYLEWKQKSPSFLTEKWRARRKFRI